MKNLEKIMFDDVCLFNSEIVGMQQPVIPEVLSGDRLVWANAAFSEEIAEFNEACKNNDVVEAADALIDLVYFAFGRLYEMGIPAQRVFDAVQIANMKKQRGQLSKRPGSRGYDAIKPAGWTPPDHSWILDHRN
jgi:predicted HAD superfamily Cof-like phosphohydrolase